MLFRFQAADPAGKLVRGKLTAESEAEVVQLLEQRSLAAIEIRALQTRRAAEASQRRQSSLRISTARLLEFTRQTMVMLNSGVTLLSALGTMRRRARGSYRELLDRIAGDIQRGATFSEALAAHPCVFDSLYCGAIRAGEAAGVHTEALRELVRFYERRQALRRQLIGALTYPALVVFTLIAACVVMLTVVVPQFEALFKQAGVQLPLPTRILLAVSGLFRHHGAVLATSGAILVAGAWYAWRSPAMRQRFGIAVSCLPIVGGFIHLASVVQFCRMTALLDGAGLPLLESLRVVQDTLFPGRVRAIAQRMGRAVASGSTISSAIREDDALPEVVTQMITVGEETGRLDEMLAVAAEHYDGEVTVRLRVLTTALEPVLTLMVSLLVLGTALAIFMPMWELNTVLLKH